MAFIYIFAAIIAIPDSVRKINICGKMNMTNPKIFNSRIPFLDHEDTIQT
jgi:hypothetical protein